MGMACALSQWELDEMAYLSRCGWSRASLASWYGMSVRNVDRLLRKMGCKPLKRKEGACSMASR